MSLFMEGAVRLSGGLYAPLSTTYSNDSTAPVLSAYHGSKFDHGCDKCNSDHFKHARTWHDINEDAIVFGMVNHCVLLIAVVPVLAGAVTMVLTDRAS